LGATHVGGGEAGVADGSYRFATRIGGIDVPVSSHFAVRVIQLDYYLTTFANATNDHQTIFCWALALSIIGPGRNSLQPVIAIFPETLPQCSNSAAALDP
jgi:hypothetical protein